MNIGLSIFYYDADFVGKTKTVDYLLYLTDVISVIQSTFKSIVAIVTVLRYKVLVEF
jgi:hypothetical protein